MKEKSGVDGIMLNKAEHARWLYTKPLTAAVSSKLKNMSHLHYSTLRHESGSTQVARDTATILGVIWSIQKTPFKITGKSLVNISTRKRGKCTAQFIKYKEIGN